MLLRNLSKDKVLSPVGKLCITQQPPHAVYDAPSRTRYHKLYCISSGLVPHGIASASFSWKTA